MNSNRRVVVTGLGLLTPLGLTVKETWDNLLSGVSGVRLIDTFDASRCSARIAALVQGFDPDQYLPAKEARKVDRFIQYGYAAAKQALDDSGLIIDQYDERRMGVAIGSGIGGLPLIEKNHLALLEGGPRKISPFFIPSVIINMVAGFVSMKLNLQGPSLSIVTACTTGAHNIGHAARMIAYGDAEMMIAGGVEMATTELGIGGFAATRAVSTRNDDPAKASRPWDRDRDGFVLGEGAGVMVLENYELAVHRGARIYAELVGFGMSSDAYHMTQPSDYGTARAMRNTLRDAGVGLEDVDYINAHATSTLIGDLAEASAIKKAFGEDAYRLAISSTKSSTGHLLGAAGAVEAIFSVLAIRDQVAPATINLDNPDEGCDLDFIPNTPRQMKIEHALSNSFGFGGTNGCLLFKKM